MTIPENIERTLNSLQKKNITAYYAPNNLTAFEIFTAFLHPDLVIASGNSLTLRQLGIFDFLTNKENNFNFINQFEAGLSPDENLKRRKAGLVADLYLSSANALSEDGKILNVDGKGNRVGALMFGPSKVLIIVGRNKLVKDEEAGWERIKNIAAPKTAQRLGRTTPCTVVGTCQNCNSPERICRAYSLINGQMAQDKDRIHVIIVDEELGM